MKEPLRLMGLPERLTSFGVLCFWQVRNVTEKGKGIMNFEQIEDKALQLSEGDRAKLAQKLLLSLDVLSESEIAEELIKPQQVHGKNEVSCLN